MTPEGPGEDLNKISRPFASVGDLKRSRLYQVAPIYGTKTFVSGPHFDGMKQELTSCILQMAGVLSVLNANTIVYRFLATT